MRTKATTKHRHGIRAGQRDGVSLHRGRKSGLTLARAERIGLCAVQTLRLGHVAMAIDQFRKAATIYLNVNGRD